MSDPNTAYVPVESIGIRRRATSSIAVIGNPNSGKSTLFNRMTGLRQTTGNYPGVTVEKHSGIAQLESRAVELIDLPGIYCLGGFSTDEQIAVDVLLGRIEGSKRPDGLLFVLDATHLYQGLYLLQQLMEMQIPVVVALTMTDVATSGGIDISSRFCNGIWAACRYARLSPKPAAGWTASKRRWKRSIHCRRPPYLNPGPT
jgi:predicted GTPase